MPENENQDMQTSEAPTLAESALERFERERLTRRQALRKFGMTAGMATFAMFSVDDLAHMVGKAMQQQVGDNKIAEQIAKEFQSAGIAFASGPSGPTNLGGCDQGTDQLSLCQCDCANKYNACVGPAPWLCNPSGGDWWKIWCAGYYTRKDVTCYAPYYRVLQWLPNSSLKRKLALQNLWMVEVGLAVTLLPSHCAV